MIQSNFNPVRMYQKKNGERVIKPCTPVRENFKNMKYTGTHRNLTEALDSVLFAGIPPRNKG